MGISFKKIANPYSEDVFSLMKSGLHPFVDEVFGWDDEFQKVRIKQDYKPGWFYWVYNGSDRLGFVCYKRYDQALHLHLIVLELKHQGKGLGKEIMASIHNIAQVEKRDITLSSFKCNKRAVKLYKSLGYEITGDEEHFYLFRRVYCNGL